jgi:hypothetical protein
MIYKLTHTFKPEVFVPILAIHSNCEWIMDTMKKMVLTSDKIMANVLYEERIHLLSPEAQDIIKRLYNTDVLSFARRWYSAMPISTMEFYHLKLEKYEGRYTEDATDDMQDL